MKKILFLFFFLLFPLSAWATTYYVDNLVADTHASSATPDFTTYNHATFETTGGTDSVFKTVADINAFTALAAGDSVLFRRGQTWREKLTAPASGSSGSPIVFGAFGSGSAPILDPSVLNPSWTSESVTTTPTPSTTETFETGTYTSYWAYKGGTDDTVVHHGGGHSRLYDNVADNARFDHVYDYLQVDFYLFVASAGGTPTDAHKCSILYPSGPLTGNTITILWLYYKDGGYYLDISNNTTVAKTVAVTADTWTHVVYTWNSGTGTGLASLTVNGTPAKTLSYRISN
jgi:hypothetical protein